MNGPSSSIARMLTCASVALGCAALARPASAVEIWAIDNLGPANGGTVGDRLIRFDSADPPGTVTVVGATGVDFGGVFFMSGLDFGPDGALYSISASDHVLSSLYRLDTNTGAATLVGSLGVPLSVEMNDLSYNPVTGQMQAVALINDQQDFHHRLYSIDLATGAASDLGRISGLDAFATCPGLATDGGGANYLHDFTTDRMYRLDGLTATPMPSFIGVDTHYSQGMVIDWRGDDGWYLGAMGPTPQFPFPPAFGDVRRIDNLTGGTAAVLGTWPASSTTGFPEYEPGDLAILPEPLVPASAFGAGAAMLLRPRRNRRGRSAFSVGSRPAPKYDAPAAAPPSGFAALPPSLPSSFCGKCHHEHD